MENTYNKHSKTSYNIIDEKYNLIVFKNDTKASKRDCLGRAFYGYVAWKDEDFIKGIEQCWKVEERKGFFNRLFKGKTYLQGYRYPDKEDVADIDSMSRDHLRYTVLAYIWSGKSEKEIWKFVKQVKFKISDFQKMTIPLWLWLRVVSGKGFWKPFYYITTWFEITFTVMWQLKYEKFLKIGPHYETHQNDHKYIANADKPEVLRKMMYYLFPTYALAQSSWEISKLPEGMWKRAFQRKLRKIVPNHNYMIKLLLNVDSVTEEDVMGYKSMRGERWTGNLSKWWDDRGSFIYDDNDIGIQENVLDVDILKGLWEEKKKIE